MSTVNTPQDTTCYFEDGYRCPADYNSGVQDGALEFCLKEMCRGAVCMTNKLIDDINEMADVHIIHA